ncbi:zinc ribbon domain-containing protein [soil metagenome]
MLPDVKLLLEIQEMDKEGLELTSQLALYPTIWDEVKKKLVAKKEAVGTAEANRERHQKERRRIEQKLRLYSDDMRRFQSQTSTVKTTKEFEAITKQIEGTKLKISQLEEQGIALMGKDETVETDITAAKSEHEKYEQFAKKEKERIRLQFNEKKERSGSVGKDKKGLVGNIDPDILANYERINKRHPGSAIVPARGGSCSGCHFSLLPNILIQLHRDERVAYCPNCGRIIAEDESFVPSEQAATA